jgi:hypothetical protein
MFSSIVIFQSSRHALASTIAAPLSKITQLSSSLTILHNLRLPTTQLCVHQICIYSGIQTSPDARFYAIAAPLSKPLDNAGKDLVLQFSAKHEQKLDCGGGYIKLLPDVEIKDFGGDTDYRSAACFPLRFYSSTKLGCEAQPRLVK